MNINDKNNKKSKNKKEQLELKKLKLENEQLEYEQSSKIRKVEYLKSLAPIGGLVATVLALLTFFFTAYKWSYEEDQRRVYEKDTKVEGLISDLLSDNVSLDKKYTSIILLGNYLGKKNKKYHSQILFSLTNRLNEETDPRNRNAINTVFNQIIPTDISAEILKKIQSTLIELSRNKNRKYKLYDIYNSPIEMYTEVDSTSQQAIAYDISKNILTLLRKRIIIRDLSNIYCFKCDFSNLDLPDTNFESAILIRSDFSNSNFSRSNFNDADLDNALFIKTKLVGTKFTSSYFKSDNYSYFTLDSKKNYIIRQLDYEGQHHQPWVAYPDFSYADLTNADFSGHLLFNFNIQDINGGLAISTRLLSFKNANLTNTNFEKTGIYGATHDIIMGDRKPIYPFIPFTFDDYYEPHGKFYNEYFALFIYQFNDRLTFNTSNGFDNNINYFRSSFLRLNEVFKSSNWEDARLPKPIRSLLNIKWNRSHQDGIY